MAKKRGFTKQEAQTLIEIATIVKDPHSAEADSVLDTISTRYHKIAYEFIAAVGLLAEPKWPAWHRLLQTRFIKSVCSEKPKVAEAVRAALNGGKRPSIDDLMREVLRWCFIEIKEWDERGKPPKDVKLYWQEALDGVGKDVIRQLEKANTFAAALPEWYSVFGTDYSLASVPNEASP